MTEKENYLTLAQDGLSEFKDRGSKFLGFAFTVKNNAEVKEKQNEVKQLHPKASHHCYAFRLGIDGEYYKASDAGEPSSSAGKPILGQILHFDLTYTLVIVVRYFGGTLLGVSGLINAYKTTAQLALEQAGKIEKQVGILFDLQFDYTAMSDVMHIIKQVEGNIEKQELTLFCHIIVSIPIKKKNVFEEFFAARNSIAVKEIEEEV